MVFPKDANQKEITQLDPGEDIWCPPANALTFSHISLYGRIVKTDDVFAILGAALGYIENLRNCDL